jgi:hypothetical protein
MSIIIIIIIIIINTLLAKYWVQIPSKPLQIQKCLKFWVHICVFVLNWNFSLER